MSAKKFASSSDVSPPCIEAEATLSAPSPAPSPASSFEDDDPFIPPFPPKFDPTPLTQIRFKEVLLISMALLLLVCSVMLFFKHWKKNYRDINQLPYYAYLYQKDDPEFTTPGVGSVTTPGHPASTIDLWKASGQAVAANNLHTLHHFKRSMQNISPLSAESMDDISHRRMVHSHSGHFRLGTAPRIPPPAARILARTGTAPTFFPHARTARSGTPPVALTTATPPHLKRPTTRPLLSSSKRASSDVYTRFQRCRLEVMRRIQSGQELNEEAGSTEDFAAQVDRQQQNQDNNEEVCMVAITDSKASPNSLELEKLEEKNSCSSSIATDV